jgi:DNA repair ATPase RecN
MLSARRIKINELKNVLEDMNQQMGELKAENKLLKRQQHIQNRTIDRYEDQENDVSSILQRHAEEMRVMKEQLRKQKEKYLSNEKKLRNTEEELGRTKRLLRKMKGLVEDKQLGERDKLASRLSKLEEQMHEKETKIKVSVPCSSSIIHYSNWFMCLVAWIDQNLGMQVIDAVI